MKKIIALVLALVMVLSMSAFAYAETISNEGGSADGEVTVEVVGFTDKVYAVTIDWDALTFTYKFEKWNTQTHKYEGGWLNSSAAIEVTNDSNIAIVATAATPEDKVTDDNITITLEGATSLNLDIGHSGTFTVKASGTPANSSKTYTAATIKITIANA